LAGGRNAIREGPAQPGRSAAGLDRAPAYGPGTPSPLSQLRQSGAILLIGTDSGVPLNFHSDSTWREIDAWVNTFGVPPMDALPAATFWPAVAMKVDKDVGTVSPGKYAVVIAVRGDVLRHVELLQDVDLVIKRGGAVQVGGDIFMPPGTLSL
jgi:imidazolonepropionase-like amidohydrolase